MAELNKNTTLKEKWNTLDKGTQSQSKIIMFVIVIILLIALLIMLLMMYVNNTASTRNVTHPAPGVTCVELVSYKDVSISCVSK